MLNINLKQLEAFVATAEFSSFTKAAEVVYLTQSTVSSHISSLETALGVRLIQRSARQRVTLTPEGEKVYREAKDILVRCHTLQDLRFSEQQNRLVIGASTVPSQCLLPDLMTEFLVQNPETKYVQLKGDSARIHQYLEQGKANLGFVGTISSPKEYNYHEVATDRLVLITANNETYRNLQKAGESGLHLLDHPMILREKNSGTRQEMEQYFVRSNISLSGLNVIAQIDNPEAIRSSVSRGLGVSVMSVLAAREDLLSGRLLSFELGEQGALRKLYMLWRKDALMSELEIAFRDFVCERSAIEV